MGAKKFIAILSAVITGAHFLLYSKDPDADRKFLRDVLEFRAVDAGHGWLIFALPPAELAIHPADDNKNEPPQTPGQLLGGSLYLMCDDLPAIIASLKAKNVICTKVEEARWGTITSIPLPSGGAIGLYQPKHPTALNLK